MNRKDIEQLVKLDDEKSTAVQGKDTMAGAKNDELLIVLKLNITNPLIHKVS